ASISYGRDVAVSNSSICRRLVASSTKTRYFMLNILLCKSTAQRRNRRVEHRILTIGGKGIASSATSASATRGTAAERDRAHGYAGRARGVTPCLFPPVTSPGVPATRGWPPPSPPRGDRDRPQGYSAA